ncbi:MAG: zf-HC2 domain-containing protein [Lachnospiraceae bacterium]|nr:zf-HC2 domain-containing protein [Lachnospiraceae bacterium]
MNMQCEIIKDLIPLMEDDVCSLQSREAVLEHIQTCSVCRQFYETAKTQPVFELSTDETAALKSMKKGFRKIKRQWAASILLVIVFVPVIFLSWGQFNGRGISFTNINELRIANAFLRDLKTGNYEAAFSHIDIAQIKEDWLDEWFDEETLENIEEDAQRVFCESASLLVDDGGITDYQFLGIAKQIDSYKIYYSVIVNGTEQELSLYVNDQGIERFGGNGSFLDNPIAHFGQWSEYLWEEYEGCYFDPETMQYIYYD